MTKSNKTMTRLKRMLILAGILILLIFLGYTGIKIRN